ncbi:MAG: hypothetical protein J6A33_04225, partial [Alphaproteobacteria bacterium]|nr:hypothetical protein [Alphaproteobacteria bacterium]
VQEEQVTSEPVQEQGREEVSDTVSASEQGVQEEQVTSEPVQEQGREEVSDTVSASEQEVQEEAVISEPVQEQGREEVSDTVSAPEQEVQEEQVTPEPVQEQGKEEVSDTVSASEQEVQVKPLTVVDKYSDTVSATSGIDNRPSEEVILDTLLKEGKLTKEQEDKILEMAIFIEEKRANDKLLGKDATDNYAEQFLDNIIESKDFNNEQKDVVLNAAVQAESMELKIAKLRGCVPATKQITQKHNVSSLNKKQMINNAVIKDKFYRD